MKKLLFLISIFCLVLSCEKNEFTTPTRVDFTFSMLPYQLNGPDELSLSIDKCTLRVESIEFDGKRDLGTDYYFTSEFPTPLILEMHEGEASQNVYYDIPQGIYKKLELDFSIMPNENQHALLLEGSYDLGYEEILVRFEYAFQDLIRVNAENNQGGAQIVISSGSDIEAEVIFDASTLFELVNHDLIYEAEIVQGQDTVLLLINRENNTDIYNLLVARLYKSISVIFD